MSENPQRPSSHRGGGESHPSEPRTSHKSIKDENEHSSARESSSSEIQISDVEQFPLCQEPCLESVNGAGQPPVAPPPGRPVRNTNQLQYIVNYVMKPVWEHEHAQMFHHPVIPAKCNLPNYHLAIKNRMDLSTIALRLKNCYYWSGRECIQDFNTMFSNCYKYNRTNGKGVTMMAKSVEKFFLEKIAYMPKKEIELAGMPKEEIGLAVTPKKERELNQPLADQPLQAVKGLHLSEGDLNLLGSTLECPVCLTFLDRKFVECVNGHFICQGCKRDSNKCPTCRQDFSNVKQNTTMQKLLDSIPHRCRYSECSYLVKSNDEHEMFCSWRPMSCKACKWSGCVNQLENHGKEKHFAPGRIEEKSSTEVNLDKFDKCSYRLTLFSMFGHYAWLTVRYNSQSETASFTFSPVINGGPLPHNIWVTITLFSEKQKMCLKKIIRTGPNIDDDKENCIIIPAAMCRDYVNQNNLIVYLKVSKH